jgi:Putative zinc-finger
MPDVGSESVPCPDEILGWIAWYPDGGLDDAQRGAVEAHAAGCDACRAELRTLLGEPTLDGTEQEQGGAAAARAERIWARVRERIEGGAPDSRRDAAGFAAPLRPSATRRRSPRALRWTAMLALAFSGGALGAWVATRVAAPPVYTTASTPAAPRTDGPALQVIFRADAPWSEVEEALRGVHGALADGPSELGVCRVALATDADPDAAAATLRASGLATFAEVARR